MNVRLKVDALSGAALRWSLAIALGYNIEAGNDKRMRVLDDGILKGSFMIDDSPLPDYLLAFEPDKNWVQAGAYIELFKISLFTKMGDGVRGWMAKSSPCSDAGIGCFMCFSHDPLLAVSRCLLSYLSDRHDVLVPSHLAGWNNDRIPNNDPA